MPEEIVTGKTAVEFKPVDSTMDEVKARVAAVEAKGLEALFKESLLPAQNNDAPKVDVQPQTNVPPTPEPKPTAEETKQSNLQKFKNPDGTLNLDKVEKSNEHLKRGIDERTAQLLKMNRELNKKFSQTSQELSAQQKAEKDAEISLTEEGKKKILEDLERDPLETILKLARTAVRQETAPVMQDVRSMKERHVEAGQLKELDDLIAEGNDWIVDNGMERFDQVFQKRPYLRQSSTPYRDALLFMDLPRSENGQPTPAQVGPKTPIISASQAVSPPSSSPPSTPERDFAVLNNELRQALKDRDIKRAKEIEAQLDRVHKGMFR